MGQKGDNPNRVTKWDQLTGVKNKPVEWGNKKRKQLNGGKKVQVEWSNKN